MRQFITLPVLLIVFGCSQKPQEAASSKADYASFGATITDENVMAVQELSSMATDSAYTKVTGKIVEVCQAKGCWMTLDLGGGQTMRVTFKDYGFFVPKDSKGKEVVIEGAAMKTMTSVEDLQHYAKDAGKSAEEIAQITEPRAELAFEAVGVLMK